MKLYGLEIDNLPEAQLKKNLRKIDKSQMVRIKALELKYQKHLESVGMFVLHNHSQLVH